MNHLNNLYISLIFIFQSIYFLKNTRASGHVARFTDLMVHDLKDKTQCFRADHLLEAHLEKKLQEKGVDAALAAEYNKVLVEVC